ncbi:MAG: sugar ABC transporter permease [Spirochaetes bacterium]|nr:sugar ABC transporter permease [Spirochaetota bacterium]
MDRNVRRTVNGFLFLSPNITGFMVFTAFPIVFSLYMAFTDWDLTLHNMFKETSWPRFIFVANFIELLQSKEFPKYFGNTLFFMMGLPLGMALSLLLAILLNQDLKGRFTNIRKVFFAGVVFFASISILVVFGMKTTAITILLTSVFWLVMGTGTWVGATWYRTVFYLPHFTSGVATFLLWKKMYNPQTGPINLALVGPLESATTVIKSISRSEVVGGVATVSSPIFTGLEYLFLAAMVGTFFMGLRRTWKWWDDGQAGLLSAIVCVAFLALPFAIGSGAGWFAHPNAGLIAGLAAAAVLVVYLVLSIKGPSFKSAFAFNMGSMALITLMIMVIEFAFLGFSIVSANMPANAWASGGLRPPEWLANYYWAKPAIMIMGLWGAIGSNNVILYQAGLSVISKELYEAADVDGATSMQKFWNVTWPQLAPTTFFIFVMGIIGGLQGGFEMARTMTGGGPAGATTTMTFFLYEQGFDSGRLGYASAVAWSIFVMVMVITLINWKYGRKHETE